MTLWATCQHLFSGGGTWSPDIVIASGPHGLAEAVPLQKEGYTLLKWQVPYNKNKTDVHSTVFPNKDISAKKDRMSRISCICARGKHKALRALPLDAKQCFLKHRCNWVWLQPKSQKSCSLTQRLTYSWCPENWPRVHYSDPVTQIACDSTCGMCHWHTLLCKRQTVKSISTASCQYLNRIAEVSALDMPPNIPDPLCPGSPELTCS